MMNLLPRIGQSAARFVAPMLVSLVGLTSVAHAQQQTVDAKAATPDVFVQAVAGNALQAIQQEPAAQRANLQRLNQLVDQYILPYVDFEKTTRLAAGPHWRKATPEQRKQLVEAFKGTLLRTYSGALAKVDEVSALTILPYRAPAEGQPYRVRSSFSQRNGPAVHVDYMLDQHPDGWKIFDINAEGVWLVQNYRNQFNQTISQQGIDGLINALNQRNQ